MKFVRISEKGGSYLSIGGELRYQYFNLKNDEWGAAPKDNDGFILSRFLAHADFHFGANFRFFGQLQGSGANGKISGVSPVDENPLDLHQAFFDINTNSRNAILRVGRQELSYGSQRLVSVRELPNNRQAFDAIKGIISAGKYKLDAFYSQYVPAKKEIFNDVPNRNTIFWGTYLVRNEVPVLKNIDLYYFGLRKNKTSFNDGDGKEVRHSIGSRIWGDRNNWKYDFEGVYQFGTFQTKQIKAWTISSNSSYQFNNVPLHPEIGLKAEAISGDKSTGDDKLETFNPLFPKGAYFGLAAIIGPSNLVDVHPYISLELKPNRLEWTIDYDSFWRYSENDGIYAPNVALIYPSGGFAQKSIGRQIASDLTYTPNSFLFLRGELTWFKAGSYLKMVSPGKDIMFFAITSTLRF
ncbi:MAG: hypothetical protein JWN56_624 [Sphingobacteriales bacterium]|nr:hypothetical protein [Sphingobacteriales bacterium]